MIWFSSNSSTSLVGSWPSLGVYWRSSGSALAKQYELESWAANFDFAHSPLIAWDHLIASSSLLAFEHACLACSSPVPALKWPKEIFDWMLQPDLAKVTTDLFQVLAEEVLPLSKGNSPTTKGQPRLVALAPYILMQSIGSSPVPMGLPRTRPKHNSRPPTTAWSTC